MKQLTYLVCVFMTLVCHRLLADELVLSKVCPVMFESQQIGILTLSIPWFHNGREQASYTALDDATGIGIEIHYFNNKLGVEQQQLGFCQHYRLLQVRESNAILNSDESQIQIDVPSIFSEPFYDNAPLEFGRGTHLTPIDANDKPWQGRVVRSSTVALYDTPYISDAYGVEGQDIVVNFETCLVCQNDNDIDYLLSCARWGYVREYMGGMTGWSEPEVLPSTCQIKPSPQFVNTLEQDTKHDYLYWFSWR